MVQPWQDPRYEADGPFLLKAKNGISLWSAAIDIRESDATGDLPNVELLPEKHCLFFHYCDKQAAEASAKVENSSYCSIP